MLVHYLGIAVAENYVCSFGYMVICWHRLPDAASINRTYKLPLCRRVMPFGNFVRHHRWRHRASQAASFCC